MRELDESLGDLLGQQADRVVDILEVEVCKWVRSQEPNLLKIDEIVAELDWYVNTEGKRSSSNTECASVLALVSACQTFNLVRPRMVDENVLLIKGGRHILYEMANETYVSNDTDLRSNQPQAMEGAGDSASPDDCSLVSAPLSQSGLLYVKRSYWMCTKMILTGANGKLRRQPIISTYSHP